MPSSAAAAEKLPPSSARTNARKQSIRSIAIPYGNNSYPIHSHSGQTSAAISSAKINATMGGERDAEYRYRRRRNCRAAFGSLPAKARRGGDARYRSRFRGLSAEPASQHGGAPPCDSRARGLFGRQSLERPQASLLLPRPLLQFSRAAALSWLLLQAQPRSGLSDLSACADGRFSAPWGQ